jgi:hypothetical protein
MEMEDATAAAYHVHWQRATQRHRQAIWVLICAGERAEMSMETAKRDLLCLRAGGPAVAVVDDDLQQWIARLQGTLAGAEAEYRRITRATYAHLQALRYLQRQMQYGAESP